MYYPVILFSALLDIKNEVKAGYAKTIPNRGDILKTLGRL